ncbi:MAG: 5'-deoxynucleotidase [Clostridiales bacterium]|jgi:5'-deoxynucleotidase|nr:5'-deoxynucleotidase [Clostridiales bacterium]
MEYPFYAMLSRMKYIERWSLMRNTREENICEHSHEVAVLAHALALLHNRRYGGHADPGRCALLALYHDAPEILTGDLPTPVKYDNPAIRDAYRQVESVATDRLLSMLPADLREDYAPLLRESEGTEEERRLVKAADKLSALIKCVEELKQGNREFARARAATEQAVRAMKLPAADCFLDEFLPAYELTLDELGE